MARKFKIRILILILFIFSGIKEPLLKINQRIEKSLQEPVYICCKGLLTLNSSLYESLKSRQKSWQSNSPVNLTCQKDFPVLHRAVQWVDAKKSTIITVVVALIVIFCGVFFQMILSQRFDQVEEMRRNSRFAQVEIREITIVVKTWVFHEFFVHLIYEIFDKLKKIVNL